MIQGQMDTEQTDNLVTTAALGLLAYTTADIAHHVLGHGGACLALGGSIISLSSVFVSCSIHGATIDLAGPAMNLVVGLFALLTMRFFIRTTPSPTRLFWALVAGFNLFWFAGQLVFSVAVGVDDWAWAIQEWHVGLLGRLGMIALGAVVYFGTLRIVAAELAPFGRPLARARRFALVAWLSAGATACATAALDHSAIAVIVHHALPQSVVLSMGLLLAPRRAARLASSNESAPALPWSVLWTMAAVLVGGASVLLLGPGVSIMR